jgi:hypothetical protein
MSEAGRKQWWRRVAAAVVGGGTIAGLWFGVIRNAGAEPVPQHVRVSDLVSPGAAAAPTAAPVPTVTVEAATPAAPQVDPQVVPAAVSVPTITPPPTYPAAPVVPVSAAVPVVPAVPVQPAPAAVPPLPLAELPTLPAIPDVKPVTPPEPKPLPKPDLNPNLPTMVGGLPRFDFGKPPTIPAAAKSDPAVLPPPADVVPAVPVLPAIPSPGTVKLPDPPKPILPVPPVSGLPGGNSGTTVKPENPGGGTGTIPPVIPVIPPPNPIVDPTKPMVPAIPAIGNPGTPTGTTVDLVKPPALIDPIVPTPGETMFYLNRTAALAVLGGAIMAPSSPATAGPTLPGTFPPVSPIRADDKTDLEALKTQVATANQKLTDIQRDLKQLTELLNGRKDERGFPIPTDPGLVATMKTLSDKLNEVDKELNKLKTQTTLRPPNPPITPDPKAGKGTIRVVNEYPVLISIVVNGTSYRVEPTKTLDIDVPAGDFTYQLLQSGAATTKSVIKEKETVTLRIK